MELLAEIAGGVAIFSHFTKNLYGTFNCVYREHVKVSAVWLAENSTTFTILHFLILHSEYRTWKRGSSVEKRSLSCMKLTVLR